MKRFALIFPRHDDFVEYFGYGLAPVDGCGSGLPAYRGFRGQLSWVRFHSEPGGGPEKPMKQRPSQSTVLPPRLSMDEYVVFLEASIRNSNPAHIARQKALEERIRMPFSFSYRADSARRESVVKHR
jgi:hypothetical protein